MRKKKAEGSILEIVGRPEDVKRYKKMRQVGYNNIDPSTGQVVKYGGLKGAAQFAHIDKENNPWIKYGSEYRIAMGTIKAVPNSKTKQFHEEERLDIAGIANANIKDRSNEVVNPAGLDASNFMKNRVLLVDHNYSSRAVVGRVIALKPEADGVHFEAYVGDPSTVGGSHNLTDTQRETRSLVAQGLLQTVSIGFIPRKIRAPLFNDDGEMEEPAVIEQWELLEISIVAVPANAGSVFEAKSLANSLNESTELKKVELTSDGDVVNNINKNNSVNNEKEFKEMDEATAKELVDLLKTLSTELRDGLKSLTEQSEKMLGQLSAKADDKPKEDDNPKEDDKPKEDEEKKSLDSRLTKTEEVLVTIAKQLNTQDAVIAKIYESLNK